MHPIVQQLSPSPEQTPAITARGHDVAVTAGAGTGKTRTLTARYLSLLAEGLPLRSIVAITFTQKAAREMRNRVRETMRKFVDDGASNAAERDHWRKVYSQLDAARISTIHSLCAEILAAHPAEAGIDPRFEVLDEGQMAVLRGQSVAEGMAWAADEPALAPLFALIAPYQLQKFLDTLLAQRLDVAEIFAALPAASIRAHWEKSLSDAQEKARNALFAHADWQSAIEFLRATEPLNPDDKMAIQRDLVLHAIPDNLPALEAIKLPGGAQKNWPGGKETVTAVKDALRTVRALFKEQHDVLTMALTPADDAMAAVMPALAQLFAETTARYDRAKAERSALDFDDLEAKTLALLRNHPAVRDHWQAEISALLVDEFQDTNARQRDLLNLLDGGGGKRFIVGDAKQSIYRFRGADVTVFRAERDAIRDGNGRHISLDTSYRAHAPLISAMNGLLAPVLGAHSDPDRPWHEPFSPLTPAREKPHVGFAAPHIEFHLTGGSKSNGALHRAADALVARLLEMHVPFGEVAILCRAASSFGAYEDALERANIPFVTVAGGGFYHRPEIRDLLNALQAIADPTDNLALAGFLRSPAIGVSDRTLFKLFDAPATDNLIIWNRLPRFAETATEAERARIERAISLLDAMHRRAGRIPVADLLKTWLDATDYRAALLRAGQKRAARNVRKLLNDAHASGLVGVEEFLAYVGNLRDSGSREGEARSAETGSVQLMTIHAAKGLEFPVVVIGDAGHTTGNHKPVLLDPSLGVLYPLKNEDGKLPAIYRLGKHRDDEKDAAESKRLLYVAATRAQEKLIFSGTFSVSRKQKPTFSGWLKELLGENNLDFPGDFSYDPDGAAMHKIELHTIGGAEIDCAIYEPGVVFSARNPAAAPAPPRITGATRLVFPVADDAAGKTPPDTPSRVWRVVPSTARASAPAWVVGQAVHAALAQWRFPDDAGFSAWATDLLRNTGLLDETQIQNGLTRVTRILAQFRAHPLYRTMDGASQRWHEVPYTLTVDGALETGVIDALFEQTGQWTIVEFKTDIIRSAADRDAILNTTDYRAQIARYRRAARQLLGHDASAVLCWLNFNRQVVAETIDG